MLKTKYRVGRPAKIKARSQSKMDNLDYLKQDYDLNETMTRKDAAQAEKQFDKLISKLFMSTSTLISDPRLDNSHIPLARNYHEWVSGAKFLNIKPFARQIEIGAKLNLSVCAYCSGEFYTDKINHRWTPQDFTDRYQFMLNGRCPACKRTVERMVRKGLLHDKTLHIGVAGQRCVTGDTLITLADGSQIEISQYPNNKLITGFQELWDDVPALLMPDGDIVRPSHFYRSPELEPIFALQIFNEELKFTSYLKGTWDHPVLVKTARSQEFVRIGNLKHGMELFCHTEAHGTFTAKLLGDPIYSGRKALVYDFTVPVHHRFISNGIVSSNSSKCLTGDTMVRTDEGPLPLKSMVADKKENVLLPKIGLTKVSHHYTKGYDEIFQLNTISGIPIKANKRHLFWHEDDGYVTLQTVKRAMQPKEESKYRRKEVSRLKSNDIIEIQTPPAVNREQFSLGGEKGRHHYFTEPWTVFDRPYGVRWHYFDQILEQTIRPNLTTEFLVENPHYTLLREWLESQGVRTWDTSPINSPVMRNYLSFACDALQLLRTGHLSRLSPNTRRALLANRIKRPGGIHRTCAPKSVTNRLRSDIQRLMDGFGRIPFFLTQDHGALKSAVQTIYYFYAALDSKAMPPMDNFRAFFAAVRLLRKRAILHKWNTALAEECWRLMNNVRHDLLVRRWTRVHSIQRVGMRKIYDITVPETSWFVGCGYRVHNSVTVGQLIANTTHRLIKTGDAAAYYGLLPGTELRAIFTATTAGNATLNVFHPVVQLMQLSPWYQNLFEWLDDRGKVLGHELYKVRDTFIVFRYGSLSLRVHAPDRRRIRGATAFAGATDELGHFDADETKVMAGGKEVFSAVGSALSNTVGAANKLRHREREIDVIFPVNHAISSPFSWSDPIMTLRAENIQNPNALVYKIPTWRFNPELSKSVLRMTTLPQNFDRDIGCNPPASEGTFINDVQYLEACLSGERNAITLTTKKFRSKKSGKKFTSGNLTYRKKRIYRSNTMMTLDAGYNNNQYAICLSHVEADEDGKRYLVVDGLGAVHPSQDAVIRFSSIVRDVINPIVDEFNVKLSISDRWQSLQSQQDLEEEKGIIAQHLSLKKDNFISFKQALYSQEIILPDCEIPINEVLAAASPDDLEGQPVAHFIKQALNVVEKPKTVEKGKHWSDDLFRVVVLAHTMSGMNDYLEYFTQGEEEEENDDIIASTVYGSTMKAGNKANTTEGAVYIDTHGKQGKPVTEVRINQEEGKKPQSIAVAFNSSSR